jgi:cysteine desulfurase / selenocysteine lyase
VYFVVDAIQGLGPLTLDLRRTPVDILACGTQKWLLSPWGSGFVYVRDALVRQLEPRQVSWMSMEGTDDFTRLLDYRFQWWPDARRFEMVSLPYQDFAVMNAALEVLDEIGYSEVATRIGAFADRLVERALELGMSLVTPRTPERRAGIVAISPRDPLATAERLRQAGVVFSLREGAIRLSPHVFTPMEHLDRAISVLQGG